MSFLIENNICGVRWGEGGFLSLSHIRVFISLAKLPDENPMLMFSTAIKKEKKITIQLLTDQSCSNLVNRASLAVHLWY